jgi:hypothetical protein
MTLGTTATKNDGTSVSGTLVIVPVDSSLDSSSTNAIQNAPVALAFAETVGIKLYTTTLSSGSWSNTTPATYTYVNASLACGKDGTIPPIIDCTSGSTGYAMIDTAVATAGTGITFTAAIKPSEAIGIRIMDFY